MRIMIVGEAWGEQEEREGKPFVGSYGHVLDGMLSAVGIARADCCVTNVFNLRPYRNDVETLCGDRKDGIKGYSYIRKGKYVRAEYAPELERLWAEVKSFHPTVIVALGNTALWALCKKTGIKKFRGTPLLSWQGEYKVIPTYHPASVMRQWAQRPIVIADLAKVKRESNNPVIQRPKRIIHIEPSLQDIEDFYHKYIAPAPWISCDIETSNGTITEVGYAPGAGRAMVIPFYCRSNPDRNYWPSHAAEMTAWRWVRRINTEKLFIGQNFSYDMKYFWQTMGIPCPRFLGDTMLLHHALQPEFEKSLGFLGSLYTDEPSWKFMRTDHTTLKKED